MDILNTEVNECYIYHAFSLYSYSADDIQEYESG